MQGVLIEPVLIDGGHRNGDGAQYKACVNSIHEVLGVCVHQQKMVASLDLDLILQVHGDTGNLLIKLLPVHTLALFTSTVDCAVGELFCLTRDTPLHQVMDVRELIEGRRCSVVNDNFPVINS